MGRKEELGQDTEGRYRRYLGWKLGEGGKRVQHLFRLGRDRDKAKLANLRLEALWRAVEEHEPDPLWDSTTLTIAQAIAKGESDCTLIPPVTVAPGVAVQWLGVMQQWYGLLPLRLPDSIMGAGVEEAQERLAGLDHSRRLSETLLGSIGHGAQTLHQALDAYKVHLEEKYKGKPSLRSQLTCLSLIKRHHPDTGLDQLDADGIDAWLAYWCRRPAGEKGPLAKDTCRNVLIVSRQFLRWASRSRQFDWQLPGGYTFPRCRLDTIPADNAKKIRRKFWKVEELKTLWQYAKPWDRALMLLALNCGFSKREIATLQLAEIVKGERHTFIKRHRLKTGVYAEWVLWSETLEALEYLAQYRPETAAYVVANQNGGPLTKPTRTGNENSTIRNHWSLVLERVKQDFPSFHTLPFKHLRKTGATFIRHMHIPNAAELASMYLAHGEASDSKDTLLAAYTSRPWKKLHRALFRLRRKLLPVLDSVPNWESTVNKISPGTVARVKELRAGGMKLKDIAAQVGLHWVTVGKICRAK